MSKLQNIKLIKQMVQGDSRFQTRTSVGLSQSEKTPLQLWKESAEVGDKYDDGYTVCEKIGPKSYVTTSKSGEIIRSAINSMKGGKRKNCNKGAGNCTCTFRSQIDQYFGKISGKCHDCVLEDEAAIKYKPGYFYQIYEKEKQLANAQSILKEMISDSSQVIEGAKKLNTSVPYLNESGLEIGVMDVEDISETWTADDSFVEFVSKGVADKIDTMVKIIENIELEISDLKEKNKPYEEAEQLKENVKQ